MLSLPVILYGCHQARRIGQEQEENHSKRAQEDAWGKMPNAAGMGDALHLSGKPCEPSRRDQERNQRTYERSPPPARCKGDDGGDGDEEHWPRGELRICRIAG